MTTTAAFLRKYGNPAVQKALDAEAKLTRPPRAQATSTVERLAQQPAVIAMLNAFPATLRVIPLSHGTALDAVTIVRKGLRKGKLGAVYQMYHVRGATGASDFELHSGQVEQLHAGYEARLSGNHTLIAAKAYIAQ
jgi:hypothetical protein